MKPISDIVTIDGYVQQFSNDLAEKVRQQSEPLHNPEKDPRHPLLQKMKTKLFDKQQDLVSGCVKALDESGLAILACQMGTGKTPQGIATVNCHADTTRSALIAHLVVAAYCIAEHLKMPVWQLLADVEKHIKEQDPIALGVTSG